ncbi:MULTISPECIES: hypothetical protein [unclassified Acidovorax]|uniref:hypothetical protein n=1 Tax=unclassified Acidovorax TaxID=2684926 RepID=UPI0010CF167B|nr:MULTISPECIES: hypothetical protein [unclassified Acidovorax]MDA8520986.1 hypothetical protein [Acidovorax sp. NCPPB 4044]GDY37510.1 hypothetical protein ACINB_34020 [Acidovorax sp. NB1]
MKTLLVTLALTAASSAFAAGDTQEATPYTNSKAQAHGEDHKKARPAVPVKRANDGSTARGEGSGVATTNKAESRGQEKAAAREAMPHKEATPGSTPK